jgi:phage terminase Nu1 subunit (DNA packaging protein)
MSTGKTVNQIELAAIFGVSEVTIWEWQKAGLPALSLGPNANQYDTKACIAWYVAREVARLDDPRTELTRLLVQEKKLNIAKQENVLVPVDQVEPIWRERVFAAATFLQAQPSRLAAMLEGAPGIESKREILRHEFTEFLTKLGVDGEEMQRDVLQFMERLSTEDAAELLTRLTRPASSH